MIFTVLLLTGAAFFLRKYFQAQAEQYKYKGPAVSYPPSEENQAMARFWERTEEWAWNMTVICTAFSVLPVAFHYMFGQ